MPFRNEDIELDRFPSNESLNIARSSVVDVDGLDLHGNFSSNKPKPTKYYPSRTSKSGSSRFRATRIHFAFRPDPSVTDASAYTTFYSTLSTTSSTLKRSVYKIFALLLIAALALYAVFYLYPVLSQPPPQTSNQSENNGKLSGSVEFPQGPVPVVPIFGGGIAQTRTLPAAVTSTNPGSSIASRPTSTTNNTITSSSTLSSSASSLTPSPIPLTIKNGSLVFTVLPSGTYPPNSPLPLHIRLKLPNNNTLISQTFLQNTVSVFAFQDAECKIASLGTFANNTILYSDHNATFIFEFLSFGNAADRVYIQAVSGTLVPLSYNHPF